MSCRLTYIIIFCMAPNAFSLLILAILTQVFQFFLTVMAVQKFLLYFFPSSQKYIILSPKNMKLFIRYVYVLFILIEVISSISLLVYLAISVINEKYRSHVVEIYALVSFRVVMKSIFLI
ncbi:hypothetical protein B9Z55_021515 [Caenorhabditis nigoni]|uniref:Uncharacterized protein n=1 Tax=Caenorhabditis nigoni TaxID=1611254 RepID=A0A2G5TSG0_9PELO|nr:hypothetical protein B9Z55_021515 [Caenorhabditis nigoni]